VLGNVLLGAFERVAAGQVIVQVSRGATEETRIGVLEHVAVLQEEAEQRGQVIGLDVPCHVGRSKADGAALHGFAQHAEVVEPQHGVFAGRGIADGARAAIGKDNGQRAVTRLADQLHADPFHCPGGKAGPRRNAGIAGFCYGLRHRAA
jgi:hypothetical protein